MDIPQIQIDSPLPTQDNSKRKKWMWYATASFLALGIICLICWLVWWRFEKYTNDAYVNGNMIMVTPQVPGIVISIHADNTDYVEQGTLLIELDTTDAVIDLAMSKAQLGSTVRQVVGLFEKFNELVSQKEVQTAELVKAIQDYEHRKKLVEAGGVSLEDYQHSEDDLMGAYGSYNVVVHQLQNAYAQVENTTVFDHPLVEAAKNKVRENWVRLQRCKIAAPATGLIAQRKAQVGEWVNPAEPLLAVIPLDQIWVDANFKEVQLADMRIGQPVKVRSDIYGRRIDYHGKVYGIGGGTGSIFSVLPPQNATGNWIKIVQRIPVRIILDPEQIKTFPLRLGLSMEVTVDIHDTSGRMIAETLPPHKLYETDVFAMQESGAENAIAQIIQDNVDPAYLEMGPQ